MVDAWAAQIGEAQTDATGINSWDVVTIGGVRIPAACSVDVSMGTGVDVQKPNGGKRAYTSENGAPPANITIDFVILPGELETFINQVVPVVRPRNKAGTSGPLELLHPACLVWGIGAVLVESIDCKSPDATRGLEVAFKCVEWVPAPKRVKPKVNKAALDNANREPKNFEGNAEVQANALFDQYFGASAEEAGF